MVCNEQCYSKTLGNSRSHCSSCHEFFNSDAAFDMHRTGLFEGESNRFGTAQITGPRRCMTTDEMLARGMAVNESGFWTTKPWDRK